MRLTHPPRIQNDLIDGIQDMSVSSASSTTPTAIAHIGRLPPETLAAIFFRLSKQAPEDEWCTPDLIPDILSVTHVCRFWRQVAINTQDLWTEITMATPELVETFLERSGVAPLNVVLRFGLETTERFEHLLKAVAPHAHRFWRLSVSTPLGSDYDPLAAFTEQAYLLDRLAESNRRSAFGEQANQLRELVIHAGGPWSQHQFGNLTSLHITLWNASIQHSAFPSFFEMLRRCPVLEEIFVWWNVWDVVTEMPAQLPTVPLHHLRKLLLHSFCVENAKYLLHVLDFGASEIAIHLEQVDLEDEEDTVAKIQTVFPEDNSDRPSLGSATKLELIFQTLPRAMILHAGGPNFSIRIAMCPSGYNSSSRMDFAFRDAFPSVKELWLRGISKRVFNVYGFEHLRALEKLVVNGGGSKMVRQELSSGILPCPSLSAIDYYGDTSGLDDIFYLARSRSSAGFQLEKLRVPSSSIPLPDDIGACVCDVGVLETPSGESHMPWMKLPGFCFAEGHKWWDDWGWVWY
jgi:hypothetical protein